MSLRKLLGLPPKKSKSSTPPPSKGDPATYDAAKQKYEQVAGHPGLKLLNDAQQKALLAAREEAGGMQAHGEYDAAAKRLSDAVGVAAGQIVKAQTAKKDFDATRPKISGVLDGVQLLGVPGDHMKVLRGRFDKIVADADTDITAAAIALNHLGRDIANDTVIKEAKRARARVLSEKDKVEAAAAEALKVPQETPGVVKQHRILADALPNIGWNSGKLNFVEAERYLDICNDCIVKINAEATGIAAAIKLRDEVIAKRKLMDADIKAARMIYGLSDEAEGLVSQFKRLDQSFEGAMVGKDYKIAQTYLKQLESLTKRVLELKPAMVAEEKAIAARKVQLGEVRSEYAKVKKIPAATSELDRIFALFKAKIDAYFDAYNAKDYDLATAQVAPIKALRGEYMEAAKDAADELQKNKDGLKLWNTKCKKRYAAMQKIKPALPAMVSAIADATSAFKDVNAQSTAKDFTAALASVQKLKGLLDTIDGLIKDNEAANTERNKGWGEYKKHKALCEQALDVKPNTPEMAALYKTFVTGHDAFHKLRKEGDKSALGKLPDVVKNAQAVVDGKDTNDAGKAEGEAAAEKARDAAVPDYNTAKALASKYLPNSKRELGALTDVVVAFNWAFKAGRFMESIEHLSRLPAAIKVINDSEPDWAKAAGASKSVYDKRYAGTKKDYDKVVTYELVLPGLDTEIAQVKAQKQEADAEYAKGNMGKAAALLGKLEAGVGKLVGKKGAYDTALADKGWVEAKQSSIGGDVDKASKGFALLPETQDIQGRLKYAMSVAKAAMDDLDFAEARRQWGELERLLGLWKAKETENEAAWSDEAKQVSDRLDGFDTERDTADDIKGITPELKKLVAEYDAVDTRFWKAYRALDWALALSLMGEFERTAKVLAASKSDYDAALLVAQPRADEATQELTDITPSDLKAKPTAQKLKLLEDMRATGADLTPAQRKLQRKLYASLDYDPEFKAEDEKRRGELVEALKADKEVTGARGKWATMDDDQRLAVLVKVMNAECKVFKIPAPAVLLFYVPPGDEGFFSPGSMTLNLNTHPDSGWSDYKEAINTVVHENMHNYQAVLVQRLQEGIITKDDPEYTQALIFAANDEPGGYVAPSEKLDPDESGTKPYKTQPVEAHAWDTGDGVAKDLMSGTKPKKGVKL
jgi:hypothetical protein